MQTQLCERKTVNVVICDDDSNCVCDMQKSLLGLKETLKININITCFFNGNQLINHDISKTHILFLDIRLKELNGLDIARELAERNPRYKLIIISEAMGYAVEGYEVDTYRYIVKSNMQQVLPQYFSQAIKELGFFRETRIFKFVDYGEESIFTDTIVFVESSQQCRLFQLSGEKATRKLWEISLSDIQEMLPPDEFVKIHRSLLVNVRYIKDVKNAKVILLNGTKLDVTAYREKEIRNEIFLKKGRLKFDGI